MRRWPAPRDLQRQAQDLFDDDDRYQGVLSARLTPHGAVVVDEVVRVALPSHGSRVWSVVEVSMPLVGINPDYDLNDIRTKNLRAYVGESTEKMFREDEEVKERDRQRRRDDHEHEFRGDWNRLMSDRKVFT